MVKCLLTRREKSQEIRNYLINENYEFYEETRSFYTLFIFPDKFPEGLKGKVAYLIDQKDFDSIKIEGSTFKIDGNREVIDIFAPMIIARGLKVKLENPDVTLEIHKWGNKYLVSVS